MLSSGYYNDDSSNSLAKGVALEAHTSVIDVTVRDAGSWMQHGRFYPLSSFYYLLFDLFSLFSYKALVLFLTVADLLLFGYLVKRLSRSDALGLFAAALIPLLFQFRSAYYGGVELPTGFDPILSFAGLMPIVMLYTLLSLVFLVLYLERQRKLFLVISLLAYLFSLLTYEITYTFFLLHLVIIYFYYGRQRLPDIVKTGWPYLGLAALSGLASVILRLAFQVPLSGGTGAYVPNFAFPEYLMTLLREASAALPLSYHVAVDGVFFSSFMEYIQTNPATSIPIAISFIALIIVVSKKMTTEIAGTRGSLTGFSPREASPIGLLLALGACLLILPGVLIAFSPGYQEIMSWGVGYLPVFISYFGLAMLGSAAVYWLYTRLSLKARDVVIPLIVILAAAAGYVAVLNFNNNRVVVEIDNRWWLYPRTVEEDAIKRGLFQAMPADSYLVVNDVAPWDVPAFFIMHSGLRFGNVVTPRTAGSGSLPYQPTTAAADGQDVSYNFSGNEPVFFLEYSSPAKNDGYALLGRVRGMKFTEEGFGDVAADQLYFYVATPQASAGRVPAGVIPKLQQFGVQPNQLEVVSSGDGWTLFKSGDEPGPGPLQRSTSYY